MSKLRAFTKTADQERIAFSHFLFAICTQLWHGFEMTVATEQQNLPVDLPLSVLHVEGDFGGAQNPFPPLPPDPAHKAYKPSDSVTLQVDDLWLLHSISNIGMIEALVVNQVGPEYFVTIDGHRRYYAAKFLSWDSAPCVVKNGLSLGDALVLRFTLHMNRLPVARKTTMAADWAG